MVTKLNNWNGDNSKTQIRTKLKNSNSDKTQKLKLWENSNGDKTQIVKKKSENLKMWWKKNWDKTQELKLWQKLKKNQNVTSHQKLKLYKKTHIVMKLKCDAIQKINWWQLKTAYRSWWQYFFWKFKKFKKIYFLT